jgi:DDE domain
MPKARSTRCANWSNAARATAIASHVPEQRHRGGPRQAEVADPSGARLQDAEDGLRDDQGLRGDARPPKRTGLSFNITHDIRGEARIVAASRSRARIAGPSDRSNKHGNTIDFYLSPTRSTAAAKRFLGKALNGLEGWEKPSVINTDKAPTYAAALAELKQEGRCPEETLHRPLSSTARAFRWRGGRSCLLCGQHVPPLLEQGSQPLIAFGKFQTHCPLWIVFRRPAALSRHPLAR